MKSVLIILFDLVLLAILVLIFLKFRFERVGLRVDMCWSAVKSLLCALAKETLKREEIPSDEREKLKAFIKSKRQATQVDRANKLKTFFIIPEADADELVERCRRYNEAVQQFNQMFEKPLWHFVATVFRIKPRLMVETFHSDTQDDFT